MSLFLCALVLPTSLPGQQRVDFSRDILPILSDHCFQCHGPDAEQAREGDLRLDDQLDVFRDRGGYAAVVPNSLEDSELYQRISTDDEDSVMPPRELGRALESSEVRKIKLWIQAGANWAGHWAFDPIQRPEVPTSGKTDSDHPIDALVGQKQREAGILPNPIADRGKLIRRLSLDLTGLPPTEQQVRQFLSDNRPDAWVRLVDRTLNSPALGERLAWPWLVAARYADTNGYQGDRERTMWPWRDWVTRALNNNLPYDQFTTWQIAGDLESKPTNSQILATGFCRNHMINGEGGRIPEENRVDYVFDMTETIGTVWLGLTLNCSRCHDHKFDPISQQEYYQFTAFFNQTPVDGSGGNPQTPPLLAVPTREQAAKQKRLQDGISDVEEQLALRKQLLLSGLEKWIESKLAAEQIGDWQVLLPTSASAEVQTLDVQDNGLILASGENPSRDQYEVVYELSHKSGNSKEQISSVRAIRLEAIRHDSMTKNGLSRSDSGNFVLTNIRFELLRGEQAQQLEIDQAEATFEQGGFKIEDAFDGSSTSGWAVWNGQSLDRDHAAKFQLKEPVDLRGATLRVKLAFESNHDKHNLGHFRISVSNSDASNVQLHEEAALVAAMRTAGNERTDEQKAEIQAAFLNDDAEYASLASIRDRRRDEFEKVKETFPQVMVMRERDQRRETFVLDRGLYNQPGERVGADVPGTLPELAVGDRPAHRLDLAQWIVSKENPLTARVTVNRVWQMLFGQGLVKTPEDFGVQGDYPVQRELLDWLAWEFVESGWDMKHLIRTIVTSKTYRRDSNILDRNVLELDPENRLLARGARFRLPSWVIRDQALAVSGLLDRAIGGPPVYSYQPQGVWSEATFGKKKYPQVDDLKPHRRSLYTFWRRIVGPTEFFDTAKRQVCEVKPLRTNTPMHALTTLNNVTYLEAARNLAVELLTSLENDEQRIQHLGWRLVSRAWSAEEESIWRNSLNRAVQRFEGHPELANEFLNHGIFVHPDSGKVPPDLLAAWTAVCLNGLNLDEFVTRE